MSNDEQGRLEARLAALFPSRTLALTEPWEQSAWSRTYRAAVGEAEVLYLKGTPRSRPEAGVVAVLHGYAPDVVPQVLVDDLLPDQRWRWFLMADAGECDHTGIVPACAVEAALRLGRLQRAVCEETRLAQWLPSCRAKGLQAAALGVCDWALPTVAAEGRGELLRLRTRLAGATTFFSEVAARLAPLPATCAHGDFWSGNIACGAAGVRIVDWGDAVWGVGSVSIANLLAAERDHLAGHEEAVWAAYGRGLEREMTEPVMAASEAAARVASLVVDVEIARCCGMGAEKLTGLMPGLRELAEMDGF